MKKISEILMEMVEKPWKIAQMLDILALYDILKKCMIITLSFKRYTELWKKKPPDIEKEKTIKIIGNLKSNSQVIEDWDDNSMIINIFWQY